MSINCLSPLCTDLFKNIEERLGALEDNAAEVEQKSTNNFILLKNVYETKEAARSSALVNYRNQVQRGTLVAYQWNSVPTGFGMYSNTMQLEQIVFTPSEAFKEDGTVKPQYLSDKNAQDAVQWACIWCALDEIANIIKVMQGQIAELYSLVRDELLGISLTVGGSKSVWDDQEAEVQASFQVKTKTKYNRNDDVTAESTIYNDSDTAIESFYVKKIFTTSESYPFYAKYTDSNGTEKTSPVAQLNVTAYSPSFFIVTQDEEFDTEKTYTETRIGTPKPFTQQKFTVSSADGYLYVRTKYDFSQIADDVFTYASKEEMYVMDLDDGYKLYKWPNKLGSGKSVTFSVK